MSKRDEFVEKLKKQIDSANRKLDELEVKAGQASGEAKKKYEERMVHLREMSQPARDRLEALKDSGESQWESLTAESEKIYKAFVHSFNYFKSQVK